MVIFVESGLATVVVILVVDVGLVVALVVRVAGIGLFAMFDELEDVSLGVNAVDVDSLHSYVEQHSPKGGAIFLQSLNGGGGHPLIAQDTSPSKHWHC